RLILDSNVLIYISQNKIDLKDLPGDYNEIFISSISYMEVLGFEFNDPNTEKTITELIQCFEIIHTNIEISKKVVEYRKKKKNKIPDAIILASAKFIEADLFTYNTYDFKNLDDSVHIFNLPF
ncbi:MAG: PIN domain-containing protein, partial [Leptospiraceae bacterium]|nr:PIN domain-containing protein [Leptospiraceae bacterium]